MQKNKFIAFILIFTFALSTFFSFSVSNATTVTFDGEQISKEEIMLRLNELQTSDPLEMTLSGIVLNIGDFLLDYVVFLFKDEITIDRLVFNRVLSLNANFFEANQKTLVPDSTKIICGVINNWYAFFRAFALMIYLIFLIYVGIKILLRNARIQSKSKRLNFEMDFRYCNFIFIPICYEIFFYNK